MNIFLDQQNGMQNNKTSEREGRGCTETSSSNRKQRAKNWAGKSKAKEGIRCKGKEREQKGDGSRETIQKPANEGKQ